MNAEPDIKRSLCSRCGRAEKTCICHWIVSITPLLEIVILQHPLELTQVKGSAGLLQLSLVNCQTHVGELFDENALNEILYASGKIPVLLYPEFNQSDRHKLIAPPILSGDVFVSPENCRLIVIDGTWRKSRKMLYVNRLLQTLPRLSLSEMPVSHYLIRKAHREDQLSTLEASCYALMRLENNTEKYAPLLAAFDGFISQQIALREQHKVDRADSFPKS